MVKSLQIDHASEKKLLSLPPAVLTALFPILYKQSKNIPNNSLPYFFERAEKSGCSFEEWSAGMVSLYQTLETQKRTTDLKAAVSYLSCCAEAGEGGELASLVRSYIEGYGMDDSAVLDDR